MAAIKIKASKQERTEAKEYIKANLRQYLEREGINPERNFKCLNPDHADDFGDMSYHAKSNSCACHCGARYDTFDLIGIEYGLTDFNEKFQKGCEIFGLLGQEEDEKDLKVPSNWREISPPEQTLPDKACDEKCSRAYSALARAKSTALKDGDRADLLKRGLTEKDIKQFRFCSMPDNIRDAVGEVIDRVGFELSNVPGFFLENTWKMMKDEGYFCWAWDGEVGQILGAQVRRSDKRMEELKEAGQKKPGKYIWFATPRKPMGASSGALATILPGKDKSVWIVTEGILKATVIYCLLGREISVIGVPGVGTIGGFKSFMERKSGLPLTFIEAYDMDKSEDNKSVKDGQKLLIKEIEKNEFKYHSLTWDTDKNGKWQHNFKGLDDFLCEYVKTEGNREKFIKYLKKTAYKLNVPKTKTA